MKVIPKLLIGAALTASSFAVHAVPQIFFGEDLGLGEGTPLAAFPNASAAQASFLSNLINPAVETFELIATGTGGPLAIPFVGNATTATLTGTGSVAATANGTTNGFGRYGISGDPDGDGEDRFWNSSTSPTLTFSNPISAFGFFGVDVGDFSGSLTLTTAGGLNQLFNIPNSINAAGGGVLFWGIIDRDNTFTSAAFGNTAAGTDVFAFDNFTIGTPEQLRVPEPGALALVGVGLGVLGFLRRRRA